MPCSGEAGGMRGQAIQLPLRLPPRLRRQVGLGDLLAQLGDLGIGVAALAQLLLDGAELLAQEILPLRFRHPPLRLGGDALPQLAHRLLALQHLDQPPQLGLDRLQLEDLLPRFAIEQPGGGDQVGHLPRIGRPSRRPRRPRPAPPG